MVAKARPALESIMRTGRVKTSATTNPERSNANMHRVVLCTLDFAAKLILRLSGHRMMKIGRAR